MYGFQATTCAMIWLRSLAALSCSDGLSGQSRASSADRMRIVEAERCQLRLGGQKDIGDRRPFDTQSGGVDQHQLVEALRPGGGEFRGEPSAQRKAHQRRPVEAEMVEEVHVEVDQVVDGFEAG